MNNNKKKDITSRLIVNLKKYVYMSCHYASYYTQMYDEFPKNLFNIHVSKNELQYLMKKVIHTAINENTSNLLEMCAFNLWNRIKQYQFPLL